MLSISKRLTSFPLKQIASRAIGNPLIGSRFLSTLPSSDSAKEPEETEFDARLLYENTFSSPGKNIYDVRPGAYVQIPKSDLDLLPEGLAGEALDEFSFVSRPTWMIRDSTKLVCRVLDDFLDRKDTKTRTVPKGIARSLYFPELSDRPEWDKCKLHVSSYDQKLMEDYNVEKLAATVPTMGEGSVVEHVMSKLKSGKEMPSKIILTGARGVGKSIVMNQAVIHARKSGWLVLFIPRGWEHAQGGYYIDPVASSTTKPQLYDNVLMTVDAMRGLWRSHADKLRQLPLSRSDYFEKYTESQAKFDEEFERVASMPGRQRMRFIELRAIIDGEINDAQEDASDADVLARFDYRRFKPETLEDLLIFGVAFRNHAGAVFTDLINELKMVEKFPVLFAVDQYNAWEVNSSYYYGDRVHSKDLCVPRSLRMLPDLHNIKTPTPQEYELKNGMCLMATSLKHTENAKVHLENSHKHTEFAIRVPAYNKDEFVGTMCHYIYNGVVNGMDMGDLLSFRMLTASNPRLARTEIVSHFFPREAAEAMESYDLSLPENQKDTTFEDEQKARLAALIKTGHYDDVDARIIMNEQMNAENEHLKIPHPSDSVLEREYGDTWRSDYPKGEFDAMLRRFSGGEDQAKEGGMRPDPLGRDDHNPKEYDEQFSADELEEVEEEDEEYAFDEDAEEEEEEFENVRSVGRVRARVEEAVEEGRAALKEQLKNKLTAEDEKNMEELLRKFRSSRK